MQPLFDFVRTLQNVLKYQKIEYHHKKMYPYEKCSFQIRFVLQSQPSYLPINPFVCIGHNLISFNTIFDLFEQNKILEYFLDFFFIV